MTRIEAVFQNGVFKPLGEVPYRENQRVRLDVETIDPHSMRDWLERTEALQRKMRDEGLIFPDSTLEIAEDRRRDV